MIGGAASGRFGANIHVKVGGIRQRAACAIKKQQRIRPRTDNADQHMERRKGVWLMRRNGVKGPLVWDRSTEAHYGTFKEA